VTVNGLAREPEPLLRSGAVVGDDIYISGSIGDSFLGLQLLQGNLQPVTGSVAAAEFLKARHLRPLARVALGARLAASGRVSAMLDVSDGVVADLGHILAASGGLGAEIESRSLPLSPAARQFVAGGRIDLHDLLTGGEDYELLFTAAPAGRREIAALAAGIGIDLTRIGRITDENKILMFVNGVFTELSGRGGYDHFHD
jgi:thiamine-monophosphate kinase